VNRNLVLGSYTGLPPMPDIVATGKPLPCMQCHLANGGSHPESADIAGLPVNYIIEQVHAFRNEERVDRRTTRMVAAAKAVSEKDLQAAAEYYAAIPRARQQWIKTVVSEEAPKGEFTFGPGSFRYHDPAGGTEPIPQGRIVEVAENDDLVRARDQIRGGFVQYVRPDDLALGEKLVTTGGGKTTKCATCHGADLRGMGDTPRLAGRQSIYLIRALNDIRTGANKTQKATAMMKPIVANLSDREIVAASAYLASLTP
jgi:cytochrome c553